MMNITNQYQKFDQYMHSMQECGEFHGSVLVAAQGEIILAKGYGLTNIELNVPNLRETVYRIGSVTKPLTAAAIMTLVQRGQLCITDCIATYLPVLPQLGRITVEHLLTHRSGVSNLVMLPDFPQFSLLPHTVDELIATFAHLPLNFEPGTKFEYTNSGYILLGKVIEAISGMNYADYVKQYLLLPAGMENTQLDDTYTIVPNRATGYESDPKGHLRRAADIDMSNAHAAGGFLSTIDDLYRMDRALRYHRWFDQSLTQEMHTPYHPPYGYGWFISSAPVIFHHGGINGFTSTFIRHLDQDLTVIALSNRVTPNTAALGQQLMAMLVE